MLWMLLFMMSAILGIYDVGVHYRFGPFTLTRSDFDKLRNEIDTYNVVAEAVVSGLAPDSCYASLDIRNYMFLRSDKSGTVILPRWCYEVKPIKFILYQKGFYDDDEYEEMLESDEAIVLDASEVVDILTDPMTSNGGSIGYKVLPATQHILQ